MSKKKNNPVKNEIKQPPQEITAKIKKEQSSGNDFFSQKIKGKEVYFLLGAIIIGCFIVFKDFITFEKVYLFKDIGSDSINYVYPQLIQLADYIRANGIPTWTFSQGMGQNEFPLWMSDLFSDAFLLLFSKEQLPYTMAYIEIIKIILCGFVFYKFLIQLKLGEYSSCLFAFLFAFCGYIVLGGCWTIFSNEALDIALILYGFERWLNRGKWIWFVLGIALMSILQPFFLFTYTIFLAAYILMRYNDVKGDDWKKFPLFILKTVGFAVLGVAISAYQLFPDLLMYIESPRVGGEARLIEKLKAQPLFGIADDLLRFTTTFRSFSSDMLGSGSDFRGWQNYLEAPLFYCGILCLVTFPQVFTALNKKQKIAYGIVMGLFTLPIFFPFFRYSFWAYTGDYYRTLSLVITLLLLIFSAKALDNIIKTGKINLIVLGVTVAFLLFLLYTPAEQFAPAINSGIRSFATLLVIVYAGLLFGLSRKGELKNISRITLVVACFVELIYCSSQTINERDVMTSADLKDRIGYNDYTVDAVRFLKNTDKSFYRINKDYSSGLAMHQSINDAKVQGYYGTASYNSFNQKNYIKFLGDLNVINPKDENATRWAVGVGGRPLLFTLAGGKYWLSKRAGNHMESIGYDSIGKFGDVSVFKNKYALPLSFAYDTVLAESAFKGMGPFQRDLYLLKGCVIPDNNPELMNAGKQFNMADTSIPFSMEQYGKFISELRKDTLAITQFKEKNIKGYISLAIPEILFFSIPFDEGWNARVNGADAKLSLINCGFIGLKLPAGKSEVELQFEPRLMKMGGIVSILSILVFIALLLISKSRNDKSISSAEI